ncbi:hypothetical protein LTR37_011088 [Vermiconidia calcicola]|uniref:Uncharacterized protein n=1 Tax=Vermiconidia calcicola TaxID=1690605 RepID=A0ACC3N3P5_9PEZI|nr:hypothetical protein LTR37_011088 [Vermiconidia calcicola]
MGPTTYSYCTGAWRLPTSNDIKRIDLNNPTLHIYIQIFGLLGVCGALAGGIVHRGRRIEPAEQDGHLHQESIDEELLPPLLMPSRTKHSRIFPQRNAFSYSYLFVGVPVGVRGRISRALSVDGQQHAWFHINSGDYLFRGNGHLSLAEKLKRYMHTQGVTDREYSFAYLVTAPRFLGYSFNPVSFWYLYDSETTLKYIILEVNNTFDERRMYLLRANTRKQSADVEIPADSEDEPEPPQKKVFTETWQKDFHVSPFNSRKGSYSLRAIDPLAAYEESGQVKIDNTILLRSSKEHAKLVARVWSEGPPRDATTITKLQLFRFIASWWWVGLLTFPRIVWQAQKLFLRKKLHVWYRPEVASTSLGRDYTNEERQLESYFRQFLEDAVSRAEKPLRVIYEPPHLGGGGEVVLYSPGFTYEEDQQRTLTLQITSPAFYSRFVHYAHAKEAFDREGIATNEKNRTLIVESPHLLPVLLGGMGEIRRHQQELPRQSLDNIRWALLRRLRCAPPPASYPETSAYNISDIRSFGDSELDVFVKSRNEDAASYRRLVTQVFLATRLAFGTPALISALDWLLRASFVLAVMVYCDHSNHVDVLRPRNFGDDDIWTVMNTLALANGVHIWNFVKG